MRNLIPERMIENLKQGKLRDEFECFSIFVDISGFTSTTEALMKHGQEGAEVLSDILRYLFDTTVKAVYEHGGYVTKYAGDAFTALFEPGKDYRQTAVNVLNTALITNRFFAENKIFRSKFGDFEFGVKVGMGFGNCICGIAGSDSEKSYYFSGSAVDLCAMAEHNAVKGDIWMSESVYGYISDLLIEPGKNKLYDKKFYKVTKTLEFDPKSAPYKPGVSENRFIYKLAGKAESEFPVGEFRDVISVFISFEGEVDLNKLMKYLYELKETYGSSHPVIDFGDKGGNILLFFGAPVSYENNSFRALSLILKLAEFAGVNFNIRAGLAKGVVYCGFNGSELRNEFTCLGNTVNQSARFMMKAEWGQVLIDKELASGDNFITEHLADIQYKGREGLIPTYILKSKAEIKDIFFKGSFVGREKELGRLRKYLEPLERGKNCGVIYVDGEAGIGKSRLTNQIRREYEKKKNEQPVKWFYFVCDDIIREPYNPFRYFFNRYFDFEEDATDKNTEKFNIKFKGMLDRIENEQHKISLESKRDYLAYFLKLNLKDQSVLLEEPDERQNSIVLALIEFFRTFTERSSLIFEIDNGSFVDQDSLKLLQRISVSFSKSPFGIIFNCRYKDNGEVYDLGFLRQKRIRLKNLTKTEFRQLVKDRLEIKSIPKETISVLEEKSKLNPLFLEQMIIYIRENSVLDAKNKIKNTESLPSGINQIILARIDKLKTDLKDIIKTASCIGNEIAVDLLSHLFRNKYNDLSGSLSELVKEDIFILLSEISYLFKFSVIRDVVYNIQLKKILREIHGEIGAAVEKLHTKNIENYYSVLAYHFENAENVEKALFYHEKAGFQAKENYQNDQALYHFDKADKFISVKNSVVGSDWIEKFGELDINEIKDYIRINFERFHFYYVFRKNMPVSKDIIDLVYELSEKISDNLLIAMSMLQRSLILSHQGKYDDSIKILERAVNLFVEFGLVYQVSLCLLSIGKNYFMSGRFEQAITYYNIALEKSDSIDNEFEKEKIKAKTFGDMGIANDYAGNLDKALNYYNKQLELTEKHNLKIEEAGAVGNIGIIHHLTGNLTKAKEFYEHKLRLSEELGLRLDMAKILNNIGFLYKDMSNYKKAILYHKKSLSVSHEVSDFDTMSGALVNLGYVFRMLNQFDKAEQNFLKGIKIAQNYGFKHIYAEGMIELAELYFLQKKISLAKESAELGLNAAKDIGFSEYIEKGTAIYEKINSK